MKRAACLASLLLILSGCATAPRPVQVVQACPRVPPLVLDAPERDYPALIRSFLSGSVPTLPDYSLPSTSAAPSTPRLNAR